MIGTVPIADSSINGIYYGKVREPELQQLLSELNDYVSGGRQLTGTIQVRNGSGVTGIAGVAAERLAESGFEIADVGNADSFEYSRTVISHCPGDRALAQRVKELLAVPDAELVEQHDWQSNAEVRVVVVLGKDFDADRLTTRRVY